MSEIQRLVINNIDGLQPVAIEDGDYQPHIIYMRDSYPLTDHHYLTDRFMAGPTDAELENIERFIIGKTVSRCRIIDPSCDFESTTITFNDDFAMRVNHGVFYQAFDQVQVKGDDWYTLEVAKYAHQIAIVDQQQFEEVGATCSLYHHKDYISGTSYPVPHKPFANIHILFRPTVLTNRTGISRNDLENLLYRQNPYILTPYYAMCRATPVMLTILDELFTRTMDSVSYRLFAESKALELITLYLAALKEQAELSLQSASAKNVFLSQLAKVRTLLDANYCHPLSLQELSETVGISRTRLINGFKAHYGKTVGEYIQNRRMERARELLQSQNLSVEMLAHKVGYKDASSFSKVYKRYHGVLPSKLKSRM